MYEGRTNTCPKCGGTMEGDGYTTAIHCEFAELPEGIEADAPPTYCEFDGHIEMAAREIELFGTETRTVFRKLIRSLRGSSHG